MSPPTVPLVLPMQQTKARTHTLHFKLLSALLECSNSVQQRERQEGGKKELHEELQADQRCKNASVYLLLAGKVVMMRTVPNIHGQHMETQ